MYLMKLYSVNTRVSKLNVYIISINSFRPLFINSHTEALEMRNVLLYKRYSKSKLIKINLERKLLIIFRTHLYSNFSSSV